MSKAEKGQESMRVMEDKKDGGTDPSFIRSLIFPLHLHLHSLYIDPPTISIILSH